MFVGLLTSPLGKWNLQRLVNWAADNGFEGLEVAVSPTLKQLDVDRILSGGASTVTRLMKGKDLEITSLAFYSLGILGKAKDSEIPELRSNTSIHSYSPRILFWNMSNVSKFHRNQFGSSKGDQVGTSSNFSRSDLPKKPGRRVYTLSWRRNDPLSTTAEY